MANLQRMSPGYCIVKGLTIVMGESFAKVILIEMIFSLLSMPLMILTSEFGTRRASAMISRTALLASPSFA
jgi:hypothetical protein